MKRIMALLAMTVCLAMGVLLFAGCASDAKKEMTSAINSAQELLDSGDEPFDISTKESLEQAIASADEAQDDDSYRAVAENVNAAAQEYDNSIKQLKQVTNPEESFLVDRAKTVKSITEVEAATEETDENNMLNKPGSYTSYVAMRSSLVKDEYGLYKGKSPVELGCDGGAVIEAFSTVADAKDRDSYLSNFDGGIASSGSHTVVGTLVIRTSNELTASQQKELEKNIIDALIKLDE